MSRRHRAEKREINPDPKFGDLVVTKFMKAADVRALSADQLKEELAKLKKEQFNLRFQKATGQLEKSSRINEVRKDIARIKTIARQKAAEAKA